MAGYRAAETSESGKNVVPRRRARGGNLLVLLVALLLGTTGAKWAGFAWLLFMAGWGANRIIHRPQRTVWLPKKG